MWVSMCVCVCVSPWQNNQCWLCGKGKECNPEKVPGLGGLGHDELGTADVQTVAVYMHKHVGRTGWLRTAKKWSMIGRVLDRVLLNVGFRSFHVVNHLILALAL